MGVNGFVIGNWVNFNGVVTKMVGVVVVEEYVWNCIFLGSSLIIFGVIVGIFVHLLMVSIKLIIMFVCSL